MNRFARNLAAFAAGLMVLASSAWAQEVLPRPEQPFGGKIGLRPSESVKNFPPEMNRTPVKEETA